MHRYSSRTHHWLPNEDNRPPAEFRLEAVALRIVDAGLWSLVFIAPLLFGSRHDLGRLFVTSVCGIVAVAWFVRQSALGTAPWTGTVLFGILAAATGLVALQIVPLPSAWLGALSPRTQQLLALWHADTGAGVGLGEWRTFSVAPEATRLALAMLVAYLLLFVTAVQRLRTVEDIERVVRWIALSAVGMAAFGLLQYFTSNGRFFWFYDYPFTNTAYNVKGSFTCRNHFAHFLVLGAACLGAVAMRQYRDTSNRANDARVLQRPAADVATTAALMSALALVAFAVLLSLSRGGALTLGVVVVTLAGVYYRARLIAANHLLGVGVILVAVFGVLSLHGYEQVAQRVDDFAGGSVDDLDSHGNRRKIWAANVSAIEAGWQTGAGAGTHRFIYPLYLPESQLREYTHAESGYLQVATENGLPGAALLGLGILCVASWCGLSLWRQQQPAARICTGGVVAALAASLVHSLVDFVWFVPACAAVTTLLAACALRLSRLSAPRAAAERRYSRHVWIPATVLAAVAALWAAGTFIGPARASLHWDRYLLASIANREAHAQRSAEVRECQLPLEQLDEGLTATMIAELERVVRLDPQNCHAHLQLAGKYLRQFDQKQSHAPNQMSVAQIRDAAMASGFTSSRELREWLQRAFGDNSELLYRAHYHARRALGLSPLLGEGYLHLAKLCFLEGKQKSALEFYLNQALAVRPYDGDVLFDAGFERLTQGQLDQALSYWVQTYRDRGDHQTQIVNFLAGRLPAQAFVEVFQPSWQTLNYVWSRYRQAGTPEDRAVIERYAAAAAARETLAMEPHATGRIWLLLALIQIDQEHFDAALMSLNKAYAVSPENFSVRRYLGETLVRLGQGELAEQHFRWCLSRRPDDAQARVGLERAATVRVGQMPTASDVRTY